MEILLHAEDGWGNENVSEGNGFEKEEKATHRRKTGQSCPCSCGATDGMRAKVKSERKGMAREKERKTGKGGKKIKKEEGVVNFALERRRGKERTSNSARR